MPSRKPSRLCMLLPVCPGNAALRAKINVAGHLGWSYLRAIQASQLPRRPPSQ